MHGDRQLFEVPDIVRPTGFPDGFRAVWKVAWWPRDGWALGTEISSWSSIKGIWRREHLEAAPSIEFDEIAPKLSTDLRHLRTLTPPF